MMMTVMKHIAPLAALLATSLMLVASDNADAMANPFALMSFGNGQLDIAGMEQSILALAQEGATPELLPFIEYIFNLTHDMKVDVVEHWRTKKDEIDGCYDEWGGCMRQIPTPHNYEWWNETHRNCSDEESEICIEWEECIDECNRPPKYPCDDPCPPSPPVWPDDSDSCNLHPAERNDPLPCFPRCNAEYTTPREWYQAMLTMFQEKKVEHDERAVECSTCWDDYGICMNECHRLDALLTLKRAECTDHQKDLEELVCHCNSGNCTRYYQCHANARNLCVGKCEGIDEEERVLRSEYEGLLRVECYLHALVDNIRTGFSLFSGIQACRSYSLQDYKPTKPGWEEHFNRTVPNGTGWITFDAVCNRSGPPIIPCQNISGCDPLYLPGRPGFIVHHYSNMPYCTQAEFVHASCHGQVMIPARPGNMVKLLRGQKALTWEEQEIKMQTNLHLDSQRWTLNKCSEQDYGCLLSDLLWSSHSNRTIFNGSMISGDVISFTNKLDMDSTFDCFNGTECTLTSYPPSSGHWAALFLMFKVDAKGDRVPARTPVGIGDVVYFHGMKGKDQWVELGSNERMLDCNDDHCGTGLRADLTAHMASFVLTSDQHWGVYEEGPLVAANVQYSHCNSNTVNAMSQTAAMETCDLTAGCYSLMSVGESCTEDWWLPCNALVHILVADSEGDVLTKCTLMKTGHEEQGGDRTPEAKPNKSLDYENLPAGYSAARDLNAVELALWHQAQEQQNAALGAAIPLGDPVKVSTKTEGSHDYFLFIMQNSVRVTVRRAPPLWPTWNEAVPNEKCTDEVTEYSISRRQCQHLADLAGHDYYQYTARAGNGRSACTHFAACANRQQSTTAWQIFKKDATVTGTVLEVLSTIGSWRHS